MTSRARRPARETAPVALRRIVDGPAAGAANMAVDESLLDAARAGDVTLRFYGFSPPCLSLGRNETARGAWDEVAAARRGIDIVRRPTGGRAVFHSAELTYAVTAPAEMWGGLRESYRRIHRALRLGLADLDVEARAATRTRRRRGEDVDDPASARAGRRGRTTTAPRRSCFRSPVPGEILVDGSKLVGSAQWRHDGALLQHGSLLLRDEQGTMEALRSRGTPGASESAWRARSSGAVGLAGVMGALPPLDVLIRALTRGFVREFGLSVESGGLEPAERARAAELESRYRSRAWTWRR